MPAMRYRLPLIALFLVAGCGGNSPAAPSAPPPIPSATIQSAGNSQWITCLTIINTCTFQAEVRNAGPGCAANVRGVTRFYDAVDQVVGTFNWTTGGGTMRRDESFVYSIPGVPLNTAQRTTTYQTVPSWDNVRC